MKWRSAYGIRKPTDRGEFIMRIISPILKWDEQKCYGRTAIHIGLLKRRFMVVADASCKYLAPAQYDDLLVLRTRVQKLGAAHIKHAYEVIRDSTIVATGTTTVVCVDAEGKVRRLPDWMLVGG
jgi:hypothetical protein